MKRLKAILLGVMLFLLANLYEYNQRRKDMSADTKKVWKWWLIAVLAIGVCRLLAGCTHYTPIVSIPMNPEWYAVTICDQKNQAVIIENAFYGEYPEKKYTVIHEMTHVAQTKRVGCWTFADRYTKEPRFHWEAEAEARCAELIAATHDGIPINYEKLVQVMQELSLRLQLYFSSDQVRELLPCQEVQNADQRKSAPP